MKNLISSFLLLVFTFLFTNCESAVEPDDPAMSDFLPLEVGNYWVYETTELDSSGNVIGETFIDSVAVVRITTEEGMKAFELLTYRNDVEIERGYFKTDAQTISFFGRALEPFIEADSAKCWSKQTKKWFDLFRDDENEWTYKDSVKGDEYPTLLVFGGKDTVINSRTAFILDIYAEKAADKEFRFNNSSVNAIGSSMYATRTVRLIEPENSQLKREPGYEYFDNDRAVIYDKLYLDVWFAAGIGIIETLATHVEGLKRKTQKRTLLRYSL